MLDYVLLILRNKNDDPADAIEKIRYVNYSGRAMEDEVYCARQHYRGCYVTFVSTGMFSAEELEGMRTYS